MTNEQTSRQDLIAASVGDLVVWPDGDWADREDFFRGQYNFKSDDYEIYAEGTGRWFDFVFENGLFYAVR